ncbi:putative glycosyl hydrolase [Mycoplasma testudineum]|uniref:Putative glycosyl hydrolase n=1 Tax=Mycoplasma testudineum TaxID=244584 RepID=A0A4R6IJD6_9MOLU|nr:glycosyl hydrolase family 65 protein [Mycoplasma testudineum]OYD26441.1 family 65 glycosyl hydrolase [Mycoplasma testudineum]TDO22130.1 putative glycosyl hydrolase [Mycoplasma testudineum]
MNKPELKYDLDNLLIIQNNYLPNYAKKTESIFAQGNSYLGLRAVDPEYHTLHKEDFFLAGFYNKGDQNEETELANIANMLQNNLFLNGEFFELSKNDKYQKVLDLKTGELIRTVVAKCNDSTIKILLRRNVSQSNKHIFGEQISFELVSGPSVKILIQPHINGSVTNSGIMHFQEGTKKLFQDNIIQYVAQSTASKQYVVNTMKLSLFKAGIEQKYRGDDFVLFMKRRQVGFSIKIDLEINKPIILEKIMAVNSSQDKISQKMDLKETIEKSNILAELISNIDYEQIHNSNIISWSKIFKQWDVEIIGKSDDAKYDALALKYSINHMNTFVPKYSDQYSVGAKGLSGEGYQGHNYWDTELFILPNFIFNDYKQAKQMLMYRYHGLTGARNKAQEKNHIGAQYPWETALPHEGEVTPFWGQPDIRTGKQVPIASREHEIHVSADVAYAVEQYYKVSSDQDFMDNYGYEIIIDTAIWWTQRAEWDSQKNQYVITNVMGPNEYKGNIDNNAFINRMAKFNLDLAIKYIEKLSKDNPELLKTINNKIPYKYDLEKIKHVSNLLKIQKPNSEMVIAENDQFLGLEKKDIKDFQLLGDAGKKLFNTEEGILKLSGQLVKQADVILLNYLISEDVSKEVAKKNWDFYEISTTHDSSLSPSTYAISAIELRHRLDYAYDLFKYSLNIDLGTNFNSSDAGIHAGSLAAIYQMIVFGYGGLKLINGELHINPILPKQWEGLNYKVKFQNSILHIKVLKDIFEVESSENIKLNINGTNEIIQKNQTREFSINKG